MNNKLIIIEGQDNCGKSTLIKGLRKRIDNPKILGIASCGPPSVVGVEWNKQHYSEVLRSLKHLQLQGFDLLCDRLHIGETCYGPVFRGVNSDYIWDIEKEMLNDILDDVYLILLSDSGEAITKRDDGLSIESSAEEFDKIGSLFEVGAYQSSIRNKLLINISKDGWPNPNKIYNWIYGDAIV